MTDTRPMRDQKEENILPATSSSYWLLPRTSSFWLTRIVFLRSLAFVYFVAFLIAYNQDEALIGPDGLLPVNGFLLRINKSLGANVSTSEKMLMMPSLFWLIDFSSASQVLTWLDLTAIIGLILSGWVLITGSANMIIMSTLWVLYHSIVNAGQRWYSFGWESQMLETGFLAIFLCPLFDLSQVPSFLPAPEVAILGNRWLLFRILIGAGLIKLRGDTCWTDFTCMYHFYETQPVPNPLSTYFHQTPRWFHWWEVATNHFAELVAPFFALALPFRRLLIVGGIIQIIFQTIFIFCGNLSFLNWLTIVPAIFCFDDRFLCSYFSKSKLREVKTAEIEQCYGRHLYSFGKKILSLLYSAIHCSVFILVAFLSIPIVQNLLSKGQMMNTSFESFRIVNTYGNFGSVTKNRTEIVFEATRAKDPNDPGAVWLEYEFACKPGSLTRRPCLVTPYHYRLDWLMWFAAFEPWQYNPWLIHLAGKMLDNDQKILSQLQISNPFEKEKPHWIRIHHYLYTFSKIRSHEWRKKGQWWVRKDLDEKFYLDPVNRTMLNPIYNQFGWRNEQQTNFRTE